MTILRTNKTAASGLYRRTLSSNIASLKINRKLCKFLEYSEIFVYFYRNVITQNIRLKENDLL